MNRRIGILFAVLGLAFVVAVVIELHGCNDAAFREEHAGCDHHEHFQHGAVTPSPWFA